MSAVARAVQVEEEDRKRLIRERRRLVKEQTSLNNSIKGLPKLHGIGDGQVSFAGARQLVGRPLYAAWLEGSEETARNFSKADPKARLRRVGPELSARIFS